MAKHRLSVIYIHTFNDLVTKLETILETKKKMVSKLISIIVK